MRESDVLFVIGVSWAVVLLALLVVTIVVRQVPAPTSAERERLGAFLDPMVAWGGAMVWGLASLGAVLVIWRQASGYPLPKAALWLMVAAWAGLFLPSLFTMWLVRWWVHGGGHAATPPSVDAAGQWLVRLLALGPAAAFVGFVAAGSPLHALRVLGFGVGVGCLGVVAAVATVRPRGRSALAALFASWAMLGITALSYLFTRDLEGSIPKFSSAGASIATTTAFLVLLYLMVGAMTALAVLPVVTGARSRQPAYRQLYLIPFLAALLVLGTVTEAWRGLWWVWGGTAAVFVLVALDLHRMWSRFLP